MSDMTLSSGTIILLKPHTSYASGWDCSQIYDNFWRHGAQFALILSKKNSTSNKYHSLINNTLVELHYDVAIWLQVNINVVLVINAFEILNES